MLLNVLQLALILLLDKAKQQTLLRSDPCLFVPGLTIKSSRDMAQEFCRSFLSGGIGDLNKHLSTIGVTLTHKQTALHEFDFTVGRLQTDLRDGVRLCRLVDLSESRALSPAELLVGQTRVPANSRLQKVHNAEIAFKRMATLALLDGVDSASSVGVEKKGKYQKKG